jgi:hypothetical protein
MSIQIVDEDSKANGAKILIVNELVMPGTNPELIKLVSSEFGGAAQEEETVMPAKVKLEILKLGIIKNGSTPHGLVIEG